MDGILEFSRIAAEGSAYAVGTALGDLAEKHEILRKIGIASEPAQLSSVKEKRRLIQEFSPEINDEIDGLADRLKVKPEELNVLSDGSFPYGACSHFCMLPSITENGHVLIGRSYEWEPYDELNLTVLRVDGLPAQIGFSLFLIGRMDGINEHGLSVTMSSCEFRQHSYGKGMWFPLIIRILLNRCETTEEAVYLFKQLPVCCSVNFLIADRFGNASVIETACYGEEKRSSIRRSDSFLVSANHFENKDMKEFDRHHGYHSELRQRAIERFIETERGTASLQTVKAVLSAKIPDGAACPFYLDGLGTLRSMAFDLTARKAAICFGSPLLHDWHDISFDEPAGCSIFGKSYENESAQDPRNFWRFLP